MNDLSTYGVWLDKNSFELKTPVGNEVDILESLLKYSDTLKTLHIEYGTIHEIPDWLRKLPNLQKLIINTNIRDFSNVSKIKSLKHLEITNNFSTEVYGIESIVENLHTLKIDNVRDKNIDFLSRGKNLKVLHIDDCNTDIGFLNQLEDIRELSVSIYGGIDEFPDISIMKKLSSLTINDQYGARYNEQIKPSLLQSMANVVSRCTAVSYLNMHGAIANYVDFELFSRLHDFRINNGVINEFPKNLVNNKKIKSVIMSRCGLNEIPDNIDAMSSLERLYITSNRVKEFPLAILNLKSLRELNLSANQISYFPNEIALMPNLQRFDFVNNPLDIDCLFSKYNLLGVFKILKQKEREKINVGILNVPEVLRNAVQEYLVYFDEYYEEVSGNRIGFNVSKHESGLKIEVELTDGLDIYSVQEALAKYTQYLLKKKYNVEEAVEIDKLVKEVEFIKLKIETKVNHFEQTIRIIEMENRMLEKDNEFLKSLVTTFAAKDNFFVMNQQSDNHNAPKLISRNTVTVNNTITIEPFQEIEDILADSVGPTPELTKAVAEVENAVASDSRFDIAGALGNFVNVLKKTVENAHVVLVDAPEVVNKLKHAIVSAKTLLKTGGYQGLAETLDRIKDMF